MRLLGGVSKPDKAPLKIFRKNPAATYELGPSSGILARARYYYYLPIAFLRMIFFSVFRARHTLDDLPVLRFILLSPWFYIFGLKGRLNTPFGKVIIRNSERVRTVAYGAFKTHFSYMKDLSSIVTTKSYFSTVVDVGANIGDFALAFASHSGKIIALEPGLRNFASLQSNIAANGIKNVLALNVAAH